MDGSRAVKKFDVVLGLGEGVGCDEREKGYGFASTGGHF